MPGTSGYAASKGGMNAFIRTAALELARENVTVNGVEPGYIMTQAMGLLADEEELREMTSLIPAGKIGMPEDIAYTMLFLCQRSSFVHYRPDHCCRWWINAPRKPRRSSCFLMKNEVRYDSVRWR